MMDKFLADGTVVGYGNDINLVHKEGESTHDNWWSTTSWADMVKVLEALKSSNASAAPVFGAGKHYDEVWSARYYNWRKGSFTNGYTHVSMWTLKADAPIDAVDQIAKNLYGPTYEKLLAEGAIYEYEIDEQAVHTQNPATIIVVAITNGPEGLDKWNAAIGAALKENPLAVPAFGSWIDYSAHRDSLFRTSGGYK